MSDTKRRSRRSGAGTIQIKPEVRRIGAGGARKVRKRGRKNGSAASATPESQPLSLRLTREVV